MACPFCQPENIIMQNNLAFAIFDKYPVSSGHMLIIPRRHFSDYFQIAKDERTAVFDLLDKGKQFIDHEYSPDGYTIGINCGAAAGQTIWHLHIHLIPRYRGDIDDPRGGVRGVIPGKRVY